MRSLPLFSNSPLRTLYDEAGLSAKIRRSLNLMIVGHVFGSAYNIICGGGVLLLAPRFEIDNEAKPADLIRYVLHPFKHRT